MKLLLSEEMHKVDKKAVSIIGVPEMVLMENAGHAVADAADTVLEGAAGKKIIIFVGKGNNGGDGLVAARLLENLGAFVYVVMLTSIKETSGSAGQELNILKNCQTQIFSWGQAQEKHNQIFSLCAHADLFIDAMLGTGFKGALKDNYLEAAELIEKLPVPVLAVDIPSGVEANSGNVVSVAIHAQITVTMVAPKPGLYLYPGAAYSGKVLVANLGLPKSIVDAASSKYCLLDEDMIADLLPLRPKNSHKGSNGRISIIAGSMGLTGAAALCGEATVRCGGGLVNLLTPKSVQSILATKLTEVMVKGIGNNNEGVLTEEAVQQVELALEQADVVAIGPGLGQSAETKTFVRKLSKKILLPLVLDADALNALAEDVQLLENLPSKIVTPHPGEMARLTGLSQEEILAEPLRIAEIYAKKWQAVVVLKCTPTIIATPDGRVFVNSTGNEGMATGGAGDVLTGAITALLGQGLTSENAALCGVYVHGLAGDIAAKKGTIGLKAGDIVACLPLALKSILSELPVV